MIISPELETSLNLAIEEAKKYGHVVVLPSHEVPLLKEARRVLTRTILVLRA